MPPDDGSGSLDPPDDGSSSLDEPADEPESLDAPADEPESLGARGNGDAAAFTTPALNPIKVTATPTAITTGPIKSFVLNAGLPANRSRCARHTRDPSHPRDRRLATTLTPISTVRPNA